MQRMMVHNIHNSDYPEQYQSRQKKTKFFYYLSVSGYVMLFFVILVLQVKQRAFVCKNNGKEQIILESAIM